MQIQNMNYELLKLFIKNNKTVVLEALTEYIEYVDSIAEFNTKYIELINGGIFKIVERTIDCKINEDVVFDIDDDFDIFELIISSLEDADWAVQNESIKYNEKFAITKFLTNEIKMIITDFVNNMEFENSNP